MGRCGENFKPLLDDGRVVLGFSNRFGGVSSGEFESLNLGFHVGDDPRCVTKNREILASNFGLKGDDLIFMEQIHGDDVFVYERSNFTNNLHPQNEQPKQTQFTPICDAIITNERGIGLCVMVADCAPILVYDRTLTAVAAIHAGRKGVCKQIFTKTVRKMSEIYGSCPSNLEVFVGPNIKKCCYEIKGVNLGKFSAFTLGDKFDMNMALKSEFDQLGVKNYNFSPVCTCCDERFFSYRREGVSGRFGGVVAIV